MYLNTYRYISEGIHDNHLYTVVPGNNPASVPSHTARAIAHAQPLWCSSLGGAIVVGGPQLIQQRVVIPVMGNIEKLLEGVGA